MNLMAPLHLLPYAQAAGMKVPKDPTDFKRTRYPHFHVFCVLQLRYLRSLEHAEHNAVVIKDVPRNFIKQLRPADYRRLGFQGLDFGEPS